MAKGLLARFGITTRFYDPLAGAGIAELIGDRTRAILMESPGSLTFEVPDVPALVAAAKALGVTTMIAHTRATPPSFSGSTARVALFIHTVTKSLAVYPHV